MSIVLSALLATQMYVAPNMIQVRALDIFTNIAITNTTKYWFNPTVLFVDGQGTTIKTIAPMLKGYGTWQRSSVDLVPKDFSGSIWIVSAQPIVGAAIIHQLENSEHLRFLGSAAFTEVEIPEGW